MSKLQLEIITPERLFLKQEVDEVQIPSLNGELGILPGHTPLISQLAVAGLMTCKSGNTQTRALIGQGFVEINSDKVTILAGLAEMPNEINLELARKDLESAERSLKAAEKDPDIDIQEALIRVERAMIRSQIAEKS